MGAGDPGGSFLAGGSGGVHELQEEVGSVGRVPEEESKGKARSLHDDQECARYHGRICP